MSDFTQEHIDELARNESKLQDENTTLKAEVSDWEDRYKELHDLARRQEADLSLAVNGLEEIAETKIHVHTVYILKVLIARHVKVATDLLKKLKPKEVGDGN